MQRHFHSLFLLLPDDDDHITCMRYRYLRTNSLRRHQRSNQATNSRLMATAAGNGLCFADLVDLCVRVMPHAVVVVVVGLAHSSFLHCGQGFQCVHGGRHVSRGMRRRSHGTCECTGERRRRVRARRIGGLWLTV